MSEETDGIGGSNGDANLNVHRVHHDSESDQPLSTAVIMAVADTAGINPSEIRTPLYDAIDPDAMNKLFEATSNGAERTDGYLSFSIHGHHVSVDASGEISVQSELNRLKQQGGNILVVGEVPDDVIDDASTTLLGNPTIDRARMFALLDRNLSTAERRLAPVTASPGQAQVINYAAEARSATAQNSSMGPSVSPVTGDFDNLGSAIESMIRTIDDGSNGLEPAELRFCLDSLRPVVEDRDIDAVVAFLEPICDAVKRVSGMGHYILPADRNAEHVLAIEPAFDAVIELRVGDTGPEQRWHLHETAFTTKWFSL